MVAPRPVFVAAGLSVVLVIMYGLRPFLVSGQKHAPSPLLGPQKVGGVVTIAAGWTSVFLGCVVIHQSWVSVRLLLEVVWAGTGCVVGPCVQIFRLA